MVRILSLIIPALFLIIPVYGSVITNLSGQSKEERLGQLPSRETAKLLARGHEAIVSEWLLFKVLTYYGAKIDPALPRDGRNIDYPAMFRFLELSADLDPCNIDTYYFAQAVFTWDLGWVTEVNSLLERGVRARTWDFQPPFFIAFNHFYFLRDFRQASKYMEHAARISSNPFFANLAARFMYESNDTEVAISFLRIMIEKTLNRQLQESLLTRLRALEAVSLIEKGMKTFEERHHRRPFSVDEMVAARAIDEAPSDPYGGRFYLEDGKIRTTSKFAFGGKRDDGTQHKVP